MAARDPQEFLSIIGQSRGVARPNYFRVHIPLPENLTKSDTGIGLLDNVLDTVQTVTKITGSLLGTNRELGMMCMKAEIPGFGLVTTESVKNAQKQDIPYDVIYDDITLTFIMSADMWEKEILNKWMRLIYDQKTNTFAYHDDVVSDITIEQLGKNNDSSHMVTIIDAYPKTITPVGLAHDEKDTYQVVDVTFTYKKWLDENDEGGGLLDKALDDPMGFVEKLADDGTLSNVYDFVTTGEADFTGEALTIFNNVSDLTKEYTGASPSELNSMVQEIKADTNQNPNVSDTDKGKLGNMIDNISKGLGF